MKNDISGERKRKDEDFSGGEKEGLGFSTWRRNDIFEILYSIDVSHPENMLKIQNEMKPVYFSVSIV